LCNKEVQSFRASRAGRVRLVEGAGDGCDVYADKGRAGYEDAGPGIRRLSAAVVMVVKGVDPSSDNDLRRIYLALELYLPYPNPPEGGTVNKIPRIPLRQHIAIIYEAISFRLPVLCR